jgi:hypothetical protein
MDCINLERYCILLDCGSMRLNPVGRYMIIALVYEK